MVFLHCTYEKKTPQFCFLFWHSLHSEGLLFQSLDAIFAVLLVAGVPRVHPNIKV